MKYYISDLHLFCKSQLGVSGRNYDGRPFADIEEMHNYIVDKWNAKITDEDTVYILGDVGMKTRKNKIYDVVSMLRGHKILIKGNHDDLSEEHYLALFDEIHDYMEISDTVDDTIHTVVLSHYPILMWNYQHKGAILIYGHTHNTYENTFFQKCISQMNENVLLRHEKDEPFKAFNVGCMFPYMEYEPKSLKELLEIKGDL